jgi:uncharacterized Zn-binding protein involved in type VI secretion
MHWLTKVVLTSSAIFCIACGNGHMKEINPNGGRITLYNANGNVIRSFQTDGKPEMHQGGHIYCREKDTRKLIIVYGTYTFVEDDDPASAQNK